MAQTAPPQPPLRSFIYLLFLGVCLLTLALVVRSGIFEYKHPAEPINAAMRAALAEEQPELTTKDALEIDTRFPTAAEADSGLRFLVRNPGNGPRPRRGDLLVVRYAGRLLDGTPIDSTYVTAAPLRFRLGSGAVIHGLEQAFADMRRGEKRTVIVPYWLGYGVAGKPPKIPPKATLIYEVELIDFTPPPGPGS
ncbi:MAG: FKBP-type peptidyl-prolyl cis-trans isomerase [Opitutaceae bacterium]